MCIKWVSAFLAEQRMNKERVVFCEGFLEFVAGGMSNAATAGASVDHTVFDDQADTNRC